jgi:hypothetical protein
MNLWFSIRRRDISFLWRLGCSDVNHIVS